MLSKSHHSFFLQSFVNIHQVSQVIFDSSKQEDKEELMAKDDLFCCKWNN